MTNGTADGGVLVRAVCLWCKGANNGADGAACSCEDGIIEVTVPASEVARLVAGAVAKAADPERPSRVAFREPNPEGVTRVSNVPIEWVVAALCPSPGGD